MRLTDIENRLRMPSYIYHGFLNERLEKIGKRECSKTIS